MSKARIIFFGTPEFAVPTLEALLTNPLCSVGVVVTQPDRPAGRGHKLRASPIKSIAQEAGLSLLQPERIKKTLPDFLRSAESFGSFDLGVVIAFGQILPKEVLSLPRLGCINIHASLLPRWRGAAPIQRAIMAGDNITGVCLMQMDVGLDTGPVLAQVDTPISDATTSGELHTSLAELGASLLSTHLESILSASLPAKTQSEVGITYASKIEESEARVNWHLSAPLLARHINGLSPFPGAFTTYDGQRLKLLRAAPTSGVSAGPGIVVKVGPQDILIGTADGLLKIQELQLEGRKRMLVDEFLRGSSFPTGVVLGH